MRLKIILVTLVSMSCIVPASYAREAVRGFTPPARPEKSVADVEDETIQLEEYQPSDSIEAVLDSPLSPLHAKMPPRPEEEPEENVDPLEGNEEHEDILVPVGIEKAVELLDTMGKPSAAIVQDLNEGDLRELLKIKQQVGITAFYGNIVLFTSGSPDGLRVIRPGTGLLEESSFMARTGPGETSGPSADDLALADYDFEYLILQNEEVIEYDRLGKMRQSQSLTYLIRKLNEVLAVEPLYDDGEALTAATRFIRHVTLLIDFADYDADLSRSNLRRVFESDWDVQSELYETAQDLAQRYYRLWDAHAAIYNDFALDLYNTNAEYESWVDRNRDDLQLLVNSDAFFRNTFMDIIFFRTSIARRHYDEA